MWVIINNDGGITMENEKKRGWLPDKKKDLNRRKGNNDSSYYFPFIFYIKKAHKEHCVLD